MIIETQTTADPNTLNFFPPQKILPDNCAEFIDSKSLRQSPLAENLFDLGDITAVFMTTDMISVTKSPEADWATLKPQILAEMMDFLTSGEAIVINHQHPKTDNDLIQQIISLLNVRIRPAVQRDEGDIKFVSFKQGVVYVEMLGHCAGCPYASQTLKDGVEKILRNYIPEVISVKNINETK
ncbi:MAG: NifU family protein [Alphaproteobacteria bacterium]|nr:NifU family protein [Alphaproteobacteria bacterium]